MKQLSWRKWLLIFAFCTFLGLLNSSTFYTDDMIDGVPGPYQYYLVNELSAAYAFFLLLPFLLWFIRRFPFTRETWYKVLPLHFLLSLLIGASHTTLMTVSRGWLYKAFGLGAYDMGNPVMRFSMEYQKQLLLYAGIVVFSQLVRAYRQKQRAEQSRREVELRAAKLQSVLAETRLTALRGQLQPHFLFNTLNMISSVMYDDVEAADRMISRLSHLLRISLDKAGEQKIPLADEMSIVEAYLDLMKCRFQDLIEFEIHSADDLQKALVPSFIIQPLVENAVKHGGKKGDRCLKISVAVESENGELRIEVSDNGDGQKSESQKAEGIGLTNTRQRIEQLYGPQGRFEVGNNEGTGFHVSLTFPLETASSGELKSRAGL